MAKNRLPNAYGPPKTLEENPLIRIRQAMYARASDTENLREKTLKAFAQFNVMVKARYSKHAPVTMFQGDHTPAWGYLQPTLPEMDHWSAWRDAYGVWNIVSQPYSSVSGLLGLLLKAHKRGLFISFAPDLYSSVHYPGGAILFVVRTRHDEIRWPWWHQGTGWTERRLTNTGPIARHFGNEPHERSEHVAEMVSLVNHYRARGVDRELLMRLHEHELSDIKYRPQTHQTNADALLAAARRW